LLAGVEHDRAGFGEKVDPIFFEDASKIGDRARAQILFRALESEHGLNVNLRTLSEVVGAPSEEVSRFLALERGH
jgi:hypothetical protein